MTGGTGVTGGGRRRRGWRGVTGVGGEVEGGFSGDKRETFVEEEKKKKGGECGEWGVTGGLIWYPSAAAARIHDHHRPPSAPLNDTKTLD